MTSKTKDIANNTNIIVNEIIEDTNKKEFEGK